jgi:AcrR family transcriptional regulator
MIARMARAVPMTVDDRRRALIDVTLPLLREHGRTVTTKQIAEAAGVAEGTIFRAFESKDDLILAAVEAGMDIQPFLDDLAAVDVSLQFRPRLIELVTRLQARFAGIFALMSALGMSGPPRAQKHTEAGRRHAEEIMVALVEPDADLITCSPADLVHMLRLFTFSGTHPHLSEGRRLTPEQIVDTLLDGVRRKTDGC